MAFGPLAHIERAQSPETRVALTDPPGSDVRGAVNVSTGRFGIINRTTAAQVIQTSGAGPCTILVLHDRVNGVAALAHFHPGQDADRSVAVMVAAARHAGLDPAHTVAHVAGGLDAAPELPQRVLRALAPYGFASGERDLYGVKVRGVQFHLQSGRIEPYRETGNDQAPDAEDGGVVRYQRNPRGFRP